MYIRLTYDFPDGQEVEEYHTAKYGAPGQKRRARAKPTPEQIARHNSLNRIKKIQRLIRWNFNYDEDLWLTLTYSRENKPSDIPAAVHDVNLLFAQLRRIFRKQDATMKWMLKTERGARGGIHHHLLITNTPNNDLLGIITKRWGKNGGVHPRFTEKEGKKSPYRELAEYIEKRKPGETVRFSRSRNMIEKQPKKEIMPGKTMRKPPKDRGGYVVVRNTIIEGINPLGYPWRKYEMRRADNRIRGSGKKRE